MIPDDAWTTPSSLLAVLSSYTWADLEGACAGMSRDRTSPESHSIPRTPSEVIGWLLVGVLPGFLLGLLQPSGDARSVIAVLVGLSTLVTALACLPSDGLLTRARHGGKRWSLALEALAVVAFAIFVIGAGRGALWYTLVTIGGSWICVALLHWRNFEAAHMRPEDQAAALALLPFGMFLVALALEVESRSSWAFASSTLLQALAVCLFCLALVQRPEARRYTIWLALVSLGGGTVIFGSLGIRFAGPVWATTLLGLLVLASAVELRVTSELDKRDGPRRPWHTMRTARVLPWALLAVAAESWLEAWKITTGRIVVTSPFGAQDEAVVQLLGGFWSLLLALGMALCLKANFRGSQAAVGWFSFATAFAVLAWREDQFFTEPDGTGAYLSGVIGFIALAWRAGGWKIHGLARAWGWLNSRPASGKR